MAASFPLPLSPGVTFGGNRLVSFPDALDGGGGEGGPVAEEDVQLRFLYERPDG